MSSLLPSIEPNKINDFNNNISNLNEKFHHEFGETINNIKRIFLDSAHNNQITLESDHSNFNEEISLFRIHSINITTTDDTMRKVNDIFLNTYNLLNSIVNDDNSSYCYLIKGDKFKIEVYLGLISRFRKREDVIDAFKSAILGCYSSSQFKELNNIELLKLKDVSKYKFASVCTGIPALLDDGKMLKFNINNLIDGMLGKKFSVIFIARPFKINFSNYINELNNLMQTNSTNIKRIISQSQGSQELFNSLQLGASFGIAGSINAGINIGLNAGMNAGINFSQSYGVMAQGGIPGLGGGFYTGTTFGTNYGVNAGSSIGVSAGASIGLNASINAGVTRPSQNISNNRSIQITIDEINHPAEHVQKVLEISKMRCETMEFQGAWETVVYLLTDDIISYTSLENLYSSVFTGNVIPLEKIRTIKVNRDIDDAISKFNIPTNNYKSIGVAKHFLETIYPCPFSTVLSTEELASLCLLPTKNYSGFEVTETPNFSLSGPVNNEENTSISLGTICNGNNPLENYNCNIELNELTKHLLITGITGSGKTNTCFHILKELHDKKINFLVVEPVKSEYRQLYNLGINDLKIYTLANENISPLQINPLGLVSGVSLQQQIDSIKMVINASFPMYGPMPYIMEQCLINVYEKRGWDIERGINRHSNKIESKIIPTLSDLYDEIENYVTNLGYHEEQTMNIRTALKTRLKSLMIGGKGSMFNRVNSIDIEQLLSHPTVIELKEIGDDDDKIFFMGLLLIKIYQYFSTHKQANNGNLCNFLLIEEAHRLFKNIPDSVSNFENVSIKNKAVNYFSNILSEVRAYGLGIGIVDQIPTRLIPDCVKNTSSKIIHRLLCKDDKEHIGLSIGLKSNEIDYISSMTPGYSIFSTENLTKPIIVKFPKIKSNDQQYLDDTLISDEIMTDNIYKESHASINIDQKYINNNEIELVSTIFMQFLVIESPSNIVGIYKRVINEVISNLLSDSEIKDEEKLRYCSDILCKFCIDYLYNVELIRNSRYKRELNETLMKIIGTLYISDKIKLTANDEYIHLINLFKNILKNIFSENIRSNYRIDPQQYGEIISTWVESEKIVWKTIKCNEIYKILDDSDKYIDKPLIELLRVLFSNDRIYLGKTLKYLKNIITKKYENSIIYLPDNILKTIFICSVFRILLAIKLPQDKIYEQIIYIEKIYNEI